MADSSSSRVLIVGAGSMGIVMGYVLSLAKADVTFLIRQHHAKELDRPQILYDYGDNQLKEYKDYTYIIDQAEMIGLNYDYIVITLDGIALRNDVGQSLVKTIGQAVRGTKTRVILGTVSFGCLPWFLKVSGLEQRQVTMGVLGIHAYPTKAVTLPVHAPADPKLIAQADTAYVDHVGYGMLLDDSAPAVAKGFADLWNASGVSTCAIKERREFNAGMHPNFAVFAACQLMGWPKFKDIGSKGELWSLAVAGVKEVQGLSVHGEPGQLAAKATTEDGLAAALAAWEKGMLPLDLQAFNQYHHGGKVNAQDVENLRAYISSGEADGKPMSAMKDLLKRVEDWQRAAA